MVFPDRSGLHHTAAHGPLHPFLVTAFDLFGLAQAYARSWQDGVLSAQTTQTVLHLLRLQAFDTIIDGYGTLVTA